MLQSDQVRGQTVLDARGKDAIVQRAAMGIWQKR